MSIEQTSQLLHLILNGLVLTLVCSVTVLITTVRSRTILIHLQTLSAPTLWEHQVFLDGWSRQRRSLRQEYRLERLGQLTSHQALALAILSDFVVSLRSLVNWNGLIQMSLVCFVISLGLLWFSVICVLISSYRSRQDTAARGTFSQNRTSLKGDRRVVRRSPATRLPVRTALRR